jgi:endonuclease/exonuclease/phosphatase family metal-dependent hydrolase
MSDTVRIASFNVESLDEGSMAATSIEARAAALRPELRRLDADILCLQEVNAQRMRGARHRHLTALDRVLDGTGYEGFERAVSLGLKGRGLADHHNLVILSRWPIRRWRSLRHDLVPGPLVRRVTAQPGDQAPWPVEWDRPILHATIALPIGRLLEVVNLHLRAPLATPIPGQREKPLVWKATPGWAEGFYLSEVKRSGQALEVRLLVDELFDFDPEALVAVCGDFNAGERESAVRIVRGAVEDSGSGAHAGRELIALARSLAPDQRYSVLHGGERALYDHLLVSRSLYAGLRRFSLHNEALSAEGAVAADVPYSFHAPLVGDRARPRPPG